jgi:hypothetical protein
MFGRADQIRWRRSLPRSLLHKRESVRWSAGGSDMMATKQYWRVPCLAQGGSRWDHQVSGVDVASSFPMFDMYPGISTSHTNRPLETNSVSPLRSPGGSGGASLEPAAPGASGAALQALPHASGSAPGPATSQTSTQTLHANRMPSTLKTQHSTLKRASNSFSSSVS